ncbi:hypothetical protein ACFW04_008452 [Cataglyphis niger]
MTSTSIKFITLILIIIWDTTHGLIGYHCEFLSKGDSLLDIGERTQETVVTMSQTYLQFLRIPQNDASTDDCDFDRYNVLHEGMGKKLNGPFYPPVFTGIMENVVFALKSIGYRKICNRIFYMTEYSELLIFEISKNSSSATKTPTDYIDIFMHVDEKFVYPNVILENIALQMQLLYHDVLLHKCYKNRENMILPSILFNDSRVILSDFFVHFLIKSRGYMIVTISEITHILCLPTDVTIRKTKYNDLLMSNQNGTDLIAIFKRQQRFDRNLQKAAKIFLARNISYKAHGDPKIVKIETIQPRAPSMSDLAMTFFYNAIITLCYIIVGMIIFGNLFLEKLSRFFMT